VPPAIQGKQNRHKDRDDFAAARLTGTGERGLAETLNRLGYADWARLLR
jgi:hypothetical protein